MRWYSVCSRLLEECCHASPWHVTLFLWFLTINLNRLSWRKFKVLNTALNSYDLLLIYHSTHTDWSFRTYARQKFFWISFRLSWICCSFLPLSFDLLVFFFIHINHEVSKFSLHVGLSLLHFFNLIFLCFLSHKWIIFVVFHLLGNFIITQFIFFLHLLKLDMLYGSSFTTFQ